MEPTRSQDVRDLAEFGYRQELDRSLGSFSSFAAGFSYISILTGVFQMFYLGFAASGPIFFWTWPVVFLGQFLVALCFAELAARYPLSGGVYQWSKQVGSPWLGWLAGWVYLACSVISLAAVALALQGALPQISGVFQLVGQAGDPAAAARNAVLLGCLLIGITTLINAIGIRLMARINNLGVFTELIGAVVLIALLLLRARRGPELPLTPRGTGAGSLGMLGPLLAASVMPSYVMYGFDTAGTLAEETRDPRRRAPRAILQALAAAGLTGAMLILAGLMAARDLADPALGRIDGGLPMIVKECLGPAMGGFFLVVVVFAIMVCALAVHTATVRLVFAMARDNNLPFARTLARVAAETGTPVVPAVLTGGLAALILVLNVNAPRIIETLCSVAIIWANLAYLMVTLPLLTARLRRRTHLAAAGAEGGPGARGFSLARWGTPINVVAVLWGGFVVVNMSWPRPEIYGTDPLGRYAAVLATSALLACGGAYYVLMQRRRTGILEEHAASDPLETEPADLAAMAGSSVLLAPGE